MTAIRSRQSTAALRLRPQHKSISIQACFQALCLGGDTEEEEQVEKQIDEQCDRSPVPFKKDGRISYSAPDGIFAYKIINHNHALLYFCSLGINIRYQTADSPEASSITSINRIFKKGPTSK